LLKQFQLGCAGLNPTIHMGAQITKQPPEMLTGCLNAEDACVADVDSCAVGLESQCMNNGAVRQDQCMINHRLLVASQNGDVPGILQALSCGAEIESRRPLVIRLSPDYRAGDDPDSKMNISAAPQPGLTALMRASNEGHPRAVNVLLAHGASVHACDEDLMTPLHFAAEAGCKDSCRLLIAAGACSSALDDSGRIAREAVPEEFTKTREELRAWDELLRPGLSVACPVLVAEGWEQPGDEVRPGSLEQEKQQPHVDADRSLEERQPHADADKSLEKQQPHADFDKSLEKQQPHADAD